LITRRSPPCSVTKILPSGANAIAVGALKPPATCERVNPSGRDTAPCAGLPADETAASAQPRSKTANMACKDPRKPRLFRVPPMLPALRRTFVLSDSVRGMLRVPRYHPAARYATRSKQRRFRESCVAGSGRSPGVSGTRARGSPAPRGWPGGGFGSGSRATRIRVPSSALPDRRSRPWRRPSCG
jgi:hypothetical protein